MIAPTPPDRTQLALEAAALIEKLAGEDGNRFTAEVEQWCKRSPAHRQEFLLATFTNLQLEALETGPYSTRVRANEAAVHSWICGNLNNEKLKDLSREVFARYRELPRESTERDPVAALFSIAGELIQNQESAPWQVGRRPPVPAVQKAVQSALSDVSIDHQNVLYSCARDGLTQEQTAGRLGMSVQQVAKRFHNVRSLIAAKLLVR